MDGDETQHDTENGDDLDQGATQSTGTRGGLCSDPRLPMIVLIVGLVVFAVMVYSSSTAKAASAAAAAVSKAAGSTSGTGATGGTGGTGGATGTGETSETNGTNGTDTSGGTSGSGGPADFACSVAPPGGYYCPSPGGRPVMCKSGTYSTVVNDGDPPPTACSPCQVGDYCPDASAMRRPCVPGNTCPTVNRMVQCPAGVYCPPCDALNDASCTGGTRVKKCGRNSYCPAGSADEGACPGGKYCTDPAKLPLSCPAKFYCTEGLQYPCVKGTYCPAGVEAGKPCPANKYCPGGVSVPVDCPALTTSPASSSELADCFHAPPTGIVLDIPLEKNTTVRAGGAFTIGGFSIKTDPEAENWKTNALGLKYLDLTANRVGVEVAMKVGLAYEWEQSVTDSGEFSVSINFMCPSPNLGNPPGNWNGGKEWDEGGGMVPCSVILAILCQGDPRSPDYIPWSYQFRLGCGLPASVLGFVTDYEIPRPGKLLGEVKAGQWYNLVWTISRDKTKVSGPPRVGQYLYNHSVFLTPHGSRRASPPTIFQDPVSSDGWAGIPVSSRVWKIVVGGKRLVGNSMPLSGGVSRLNVWDHALTAEEVGWLVSNLYTPESLAST